MVGQSEQQPNKKRRGKLQGWLLASGGGALSLVGLFVYHALVPAVTTTGETLGKSFDQMVRGKLGADAQAEARPVPVAESPITDSVAPDVPAAAPAGQPDAGIAVTLQSALPSSLDQPAADAVRQAVAGLEGGAVRRVQISLGRPELGGQATMAAATWRVSGAAGHADCSANFRFYTPQELGRLLSDRIRTSIISSHEGEFSCD